MLWNRLIVWIVVLLTEVLIHQTAFANIKGKDQQSFSIEASVMYLGEFPALPLGSDAKLIGKIIVSPDSKRMAYILRYYGKYSAVVDGFQWKEYDYVYNLRFSPDSKHVEYVAKCDGVCFAVVDGVEGKAYSVQPSDVLFERKSNIVSPDGKRIAYVAKQDSSFFHYDNEFVVVNGKKGKKYDAVLENSLRFSHDSKRLAYVAGHFKRSFFRWKRLLQVKHFVVVNGKEGKKYDHMFSDSLRFSPDSKRVAYVAIRVRKKFFWFGERIAKRCVVVNGKEGKEYGEEKGRGLIPSPVFTPDSKYVVCIVKDDYNAFIVVDGKIVPEPLPLYKEYDYSNKYIGLLEDSEIVFDGPRSLHFLAETYNNEIYRIDIKIKEK